MVICGLRSGPRQQKLLGGRDKVFGEEAVQNRMAVDLVRPLDKGVIRDDENAKRATRDLIEHILEQAEILPEALSMESSEHRQKPASDQGPHS